MLSNYHTHTKRCQHASGEDEEYVECAVAEGLKLLGFSDHAPMPFPDGYSSYYKMANEEASEYASSIRALSEKYKGTIDIRLGLEAEYYPENFDASIKYWRELGIEYIILGQHFSLAPEWDSARHAAFAPSDEAQLLSYTDLCCEALKTGKFTYLAHPDVLNYSGEDHGLYEECTKRLVMAANDTETPLEINLLGLRTGRHYPNERFWEIASRYSPKVIIGTDAHSPEQLKCKEFENKALQLAKKYGLEIVDKLNFKQI